MKKSLALMLALIMALCMIPTTAFAADIIDQKNSVSIYKGEPTYSYFLRNFPGGSITKQKNEEVTWQRLPRYTNICNCGRVLEEVIPDLYCINPDKNIKITNPKVIGECGVRVASWKGNDVYNGYPCFEFYCKAAKAGETDVTVTYYYNYNYRGASGYCNNCGRRVTVPAQTTWYEEFVTFHVKVVGEDPVGIPDKPTDISGIVGDNAVNVHCTNSTANHFDKSYGLMPNSYTVSEVEGNAKNGYTCTITVQSEKYVNDYNASINVNHKLDGSSTGTIKLKWNETDKKWEVVSALPVVFDVKCETQEPPTDKPEPPTPPNTSKPFIELTGEEAVKVHCTNDKANHADKSYGLMHDGYTVGDVEGNATSGYTCDITVKPEKYVEAYNSDPDINVEHKLDPESQPGKIKLEWDKYNQKWKLATPSGVPVVFNVKCDNTQPPLDGNITIEVSKVWDDGSNKPEQITVQLWANGKEVGQPATIMPDNEDTWFHRFNNMPAKDSNGNLINYTVTEENVPAGWTPYYWTADKLIFRIHNVPTENTREIKVTKKVSGEGADKEKYFDFKVTLFQDLDGNGEIGVGTHPLSDTYTFGGVTFTNGVATFKLKDGDSKEITGIPSHVQYLPLLYKVEEIAPNGYTVKVNGKEGSSINGDFAGDNKTVNIAFENVKESGTNPTPPTPGGGNGSGGHYHPTTPVPVIVIPPKTGDMTIWQSILHFLGIR